MFGGSYKISKNFTIHAAFEIAPSIEQNGSSNNIIAKEYQGSVSELGNTFGHFSFSWGL